MALALQSILYGSQSAPTIRWIPGADGDRTRASCELLGLSASELGAVADRTPTDERWRSLFSVYVDRPGQSSQRSRPPIAGEYQVIGDVIRFTPRYPLVPGLSYRADFDRGLVPGATQTPSPPISATFSLPKRLERSTTSVARVDPIVDVLPENQLKLYLHFSAPMRRGGAYDYIRLIDFEGSTVDLPFLELGEELWDPESRRLTVLFDPGRIKRGLKPREDLGPVLVEGRRYRLVIDQAWRDAQGNELAGSHEKVFRVGPPDTSPPDPKTWAIQAPRAGSRRPLGIEFHEPLDRAMLDRCLIVRGPDGPIPGSAQPSDDARSWRFVPRDPWGEGAHTLVVDSALEDLAGNSISRPFEVDAERPIERQIAGDTYELAFEIASGP